MVDSRVARLHLEKNEGTQNKGSPKIYNSEAKRGGWRRRCYAQHRRRQGNRLFTPNRGAITPNRSAITPNRRVPDCREVTEHSREGRAVGRVGCAVNRGRHHGRSTHAQRRENQEHRHHLHQFLHCPIPPFMG